MRQDRLATDLKRQPRVVDPAKLARQISLFGRSAVGMPPPWVYEGSDGVLVLYNGVTRATRIAKLVPGALIRVEVIGKLPKAYGADPRIGDLLPMTPDLQREALTLLTEGGRCRRMCGSASCSRPWGSWASAHLGRGLGYIDDDELIAILYRHRAELTARAQPRPEPVLEPTGAGTSVSGSPK